MSYNFESVTVLVVDDNSPMLEITKSLLLTFGVGNVLTAKDGERAYELYMQYNPDLIITDWMMRPMDGITLARKIRKSKNSINPYVPIVLMTGFSEKHRIFEARDEGITEILVKPFMARDLYKRFYQIIEKPRQFVKSDEFFGPDRRRRADAKDGYNGPRRRQDDIEKMFPASEKELSRQSERELAKAREHLQKVKNDTGAKEDKEIEINDFNIEIEMVDSDNE